MDYATLLGLSPLFGLGQNVETDTSLQNLPGTSEKGKVKEEDKKKQGPFDVTFTDAQLAALGRMAAGQDMEQPRIHTPAVVPPRVPNVMPMVSAQLPQVQQPQRPTLASLIYGGR